MLHVTQRKNMVAWPSQYRQHHVSGGRLSLWVEWAWLIGKKCKNTFLLEQNSCKKNSKYKQNAFFNVSKAHLEKNAIVASMYSAGSFMYIIKCNTD